MRLSAVTKRIVKTLPKRYGLVQISHQPRRPTSTITYGRLFAASSAAAIERFDKATWESVIPGAQTRALGATLRGNIDVLTVTRVALYSEDIPFVSSDATTLVQRGWNFIRRSVIILDQDTNEVLGVVLAASHCNAVRKACALQPAAAKAMLEATPDISDRKIIAARGHACEGPMVMTGMFFHPYEWDKLNKTHGKYRHYATKHANDDDEHHTECVGKWFAHLYGLEKAFLPAAAANRLHTAMDTKFPDFLPGVPLGLVPGAAGCMTRGYACAQHADSAATGMAELIAFSDAAPLNLPRAHHWAFAISDTKCVLDLQALSDGQGVLVAIRGSNLLHGTLVTKRGNGNHVLHHGLGSALVLRTVDAGSGSWRLQASTPSQPRSYRLA